MKIKVSEATPAQLDWMVAHALGLTVIPPRPYMSSPDHEPEYVTGLTIPETPA